MATSPEHADISSSIVRQIALFGGRIDKLVPQGLADEISEALSGGRNQGQEG